MRTIFETPDRSYRIVEVEDFDFDLENLKGDVFNPDVNTEIDSVKLKEEELRFESEAQDLGVFGYRLEKWNEEPGTGYEELDSCYGFVGMHEDSTSSKYHHYIVAEMIERIESELKRD